MLTSCAPVRTVAVVAALGAGVPAQAGDEPLPPPSHVVRGETRTGSNIRPTVVTGGAISLNRRYDELTPDERRRVRGWYEAMPEADEPPFPADGLGAVYATLQKIAAREHELGEWTFVVSIDPAGEATSVSLLRGEATEGTRQMATGLMLTKYKPGLCAGQPCATTFPVRFRMSRKL